MVNVSKMSNTCECCHRKLRFIRQINGNFMHSMVIPECFVKYFGGKIPETVKLEAANGNIYDVGVTESMNRTILKSGWAAFVDANIIEENYSLMFQYLGNARFEVTIFDSNGQEKALCCAGMKTASDVKTPNSRYVGNSSSSCHGTTQLSSGEGSDSDGCPNESSCHYCESAKTAALSYTSDEFSEDNPSADESLELDDFQMLPKDCVLSGRCGLTVAQKANIHAFVAEFQPEIPVLVVLMKKTNVEPKTDLVIRKDYALVYFPCESQTITLQVPMKSKDWQCNLPVRPDGGCNLRLGNFVHDNNVRVGDICLFQPMTNAKQRTFTMTVHLLQNSSIDHSPGGRTDICLNHGRTSKEVAGVKDEPPADGEEISFSDHEEHGTSESSKGNYVESDYRHLVLPDDIVLSGRCYLTEEQEVQIQALVSRMQPETPVLVVVMKKTNVKPCGNLVIRKDYALKYIPCEDTNIILQVPMKNNTWKCKLQIRPSGVSDAGRRNLYLGNFVRDNNVREGDIWLFQPMANVKNRRFTMRVHLLHKASIDHSPDRRTGIGSNHGRTSTNITGDGEGISSSDHEEHGTSESPEGASEPPFILPDRMRLTPAQGKKVLEKVEEIETELPIYVVIMNKMNVCRCNTSPVLNFGVRYATTYLEKKHVTGHHGKEGVISLVLQRDPKSGTWATEMRWSTHRSSPQLRVVKGWPSFSRANHLREGDLCLFKLMKNEEPLKMMVYIIRHDKC
ncbi:hypothetical protein ACQ4PT_026280 [Festuca glaucescens]